MVKISYWMTEWYTYKVKVVGRTVDLHILRFKKRGSDIVFVTECHQTVNRF